MRADILSIPRPGSVASYGDSIHFLRGMGVPTNLLAGLFQTTPENIRQVGSRLIRVLQDVAPPAALNNLLKRYKEEMEWNELRTKSGGLPLLRKTRLDEFEASILNDRQQYEHNSRFLEGASALRLYLPLVARASTPEVLRLRAIVYEQIAWFNSHSGHSRSSVEFAVEAMRVALRAFNRSLGDRQLLVQYSESALIASNSLLNAHQWRSALRFLDHADAANLARGEPLGSEHFRQRAVAMFQAGHDHEAAKLFVQAKTAGMTERTAPSEIDLEVASDRPLCLLRPLSGFEKVMQLVDRVKAHFGVDSLQHGMAVNWTFATALRTDDPQNLQAVFPLLNGVTTSVRHFGHEATMSFLLSITSALHLSSDQQYRWIRFLLYENAFRRR